MCVRGSGGPYGSPLVVDGDGVDGRGEGERSVVVGWLVGSSKLYNWFAYETVNFFFVFKLC